MALANLASMNVKAHRLLNNTTVVLIFNYFNFIHSSAGLSFSLSLSLSLSLSHTHTCTYTLSLTLPLSCMHTSDLWTIGASDLLINQKKLFLNSLSKFFLLEFFFCWCFEKNSNRQLFIFFPCSFLKRLFPKTSSSSPFGRQTRPAMTSDTFGSLINKHKPNICR